jgi:hypothetical protein
MTVLRSTAEFDRWVAFVGAMPLPIEVEAKRHKPTRSSEANRYLRAVETDIGQHVGYTMDECHEWLLGSYFGWKDRKVPRTPRNPDGIVSVPVRTTTTNEEGKRQVLNKAEFAKFAQHVERVAAQAGVFVNERWENANQ